MFADRAGDLSDRHTMDRSGAVTKPVTTWSCSPTTNEELSLDCGDGRSFTRFGSIVVAKRWHVTLATGRAVSEAVGPFDVWRGKRNQFVVEEAKSASRWMALFGACFHIMLLIVTWHAGLATWRLGALVASFVSFSLLQFTMMRRAHIPENFERRFIVMNLSSQIYVVAMVSLTGGVHSPFVPGMVLPAIISLLFFGPQPVSRWIALGNGLLIVAMACPAAARSSAMAFRTCRLRAGADDRLGLEPRRAPPCRRQDRERGVSRR